MYDLLDVTEELLSGLVKEVTGSYTTVLQREGKTYTVNWERPWKRIPMIKTLEEKTGESFLLQLNFIPRNLSSFYTEFSRK